MTPTKTDPDVPPKRPRTPRESTIDLKGALKLRGLSLAETARQLKLKSPDQLRQWLKRERMPERHLRAVAELSGISYDELLNHFDIAAPRRSHAADVQEALNANDRSIHNALRIMDRRVDRAMDAHLETYEDIRFLVNNMTKKDVAIYCSLNRIPYEMEPDGLAQLAPRFADAVRADAYFFYLYPKDELLKTFRKQQIPNLLSAHDFKNSFGNFCQSVSKGPGRPDLEDVEKHCYMLSCEDSAFMVPGFKFILFRPAESHEQHQMPPRLIVSTPAGTSTQHVDLQLPLARDVTNQFLSSAKHVLHAHEKEIGGVLDLLSL